MKKSTMLAAAAAATFISSTQAHQAGDLIVRAGAANVSPDASSSELVVSGGAVAGSSADVKDNTQLGLTLTYMMTDNWGVDVLASTPFKHDITANTGALGLGTVNAGDTKHLPPTVSLVYFPADASATFQPFVGLGANYTHFFEEDVDAQLEGVLGAGSLNLDGSFGLAVQAGFDYQLSDDIWLNGTVRWIDIDTDARFEFTGADIETDVEIDPLVYMLSLGWKF